MKPIINHLIQLQELSVARAQQEASMPGTQLTELDNSIKSLQKDLPPDLNTFYKKMSLKDMLAIVPIANGVCTACGMKLPVSMVQAVKLSEKIEHCKSCARILYHTDALPKRIAEERRRTDPPKVGIARFSAPSLMVPNLTAKTKEEAIEILATTLHEGGFVESSERLSEEALRREAIISTGVENGLAFPHVRGVEGGGLALALGISQKGIKFGGPGRTNTRIFFFMVIPTAASAFYLKLLSGLTQAFQKDEAREKLMAAETPDALWKALLRTTKSKIQ